MSFATLLHVSLTFIDREIFRDVGLQIEPGDRVGLVGPNGAGKTTLLRLLIGEMQPDQGEVRVARGTRMGYLPQDIQETSSGPLLPSIVDTIPGRVSLRKEIGKAEAELAHSPRQEDQARLAEKLAELHQTMAHLDEQFPRHEAEKILVGLGFRESDFSAPMNTLSGGWKMRAALAGLLYQRPDLLLMDEPTNHLDIPSVRWLEQYLQGFDGAMVLVSHDRDFLNRQVSRIVSLEPEGVRTYSGNYDSYLKARQEEIKGFQARQRNQEQKVKEAERFIERFRAKASKARQAQSKIKLLKKMEMVQSHRRQKEVRFSFPEVARSGRVVLSVEKLSKRFGENILYENLNLNVLRGDRVAVIGPNGSGKTTLLKMVAGELKPDQGRISLGHGVTAGYFAQHHSEALDLYKTVVEEVYQVVPDESVGFVRNVCGAFLFSGNDVEKPVSVLSGGEKARVSLAKLLVKPGNFMVMDEPTNHLDLISSEKLIDALAQYTGTILFVSHNQSFINRLATKIWDLRDREVVEYPGSLDEYYDHLNRLEEEGYSWSDGVPAEEKDNSLMTEDREGEPGAAGKRDRKAERRERAERREQIRQALEPLQTQVQELEERIAQLESRQQELEKMLSDPRLFGNGGKSVPLLREHGENREVLDDLLKKWENSHIKLEVAKRDLGL